jgi:hypothetical protein
VPSRYEHLTHGQLARLVPELLLTGHLIDRAGMPYCIEAFGPEGMTQIAIEEWSGASPVYTRRMQSALHFEGDDVVTIFKGMQFDIGAPPQFMDFRYWIEDRNHGGFELAHCGALLDVEPVGESFVQAMCHDIEDPTFDATAVATNPRARMRPIHRPPRRPADRHPHCAWTVTIEPAATAAEPSPAVAMLAASHAGGLTLDPISPGEPGLTRYDGDLLSDIDFGAFARSALVRIADEVCLQMHLLNLSFLHAVRQRAGVGEVLLRVATSQLTGHAGVTAERLHAAMSLGRTPADAARLIELHPIVNPQPYVEFARDDATISVRHSLAHEDGAWISYCGPDSIEPLRAIVRAVDSRFDIVVTGTATHWTATVVPTQAPVREADPVAVTKFSKGAAFQFQPRRSLPLTVL